MRDYQQILIMSLGLLVLAGCASRPTGANLTRAVPTATACAKVGAGNAQGPRSAISGSGEVGPAEGTSSGGTPPATPDVAGGNPPDSVPTAGAAAVTGPPGGETRIGVPSATPVPGAAVAGAQGQGEVVGTPNSADAIVTPTVLPDLDTVNLPDPVIPSSGSPVRGPEGNETMPNPCP